MVQAALGALIGELMMGQRLGNWALAWGALVGISPNAEWLVTPILSTAGKLMWLGGFSHSLLVMAAWAYIIAIALAWFWRPKKIEKATALAFVSVVLVGHLVLDTLTVTGAGIFWPFVSKRVAFNLLDRNDFVLAMLWVFLIGWIAFTKEVKPKKSRGKKPVSTQMPKRRKLCLWGLGLGFFYLIFGVTMKSIASAGFEADLVRRGVKFERKHIGPMPYNFLLWRSVVDRGSELWVGYRSVFDSSGIPVRWTVYSRGQEALQQVTKVSETDDLKQLTDGCWIARPNAKGAWLGDLRLPESRTWEVRKTMVDSRLAQSWVIDLKSDQDPLREVMTHPQDNDDFIKRMVSRIFGNHEQWEGNPRLAGVVGSLPESLPIYEN